MPSSHRDAKRVERERTRVEKSDPMLDKVGEAEAETHDARRTIAVALPDEIAAKIDAAFKLSWPKSNTGRDVPYDDLDCRMRDMIERLPTGAHLCLGDIGQMPQLMWQEALAQMPKPKASRGPRLTTIRDQAKKIGAPAFAKDGITYFLHDLGQQATGNDTDAEWAEFEARHGKA